MCKNMERLTDYSVASFIADKIPDSPENLKTPQGLCTMLVYLEIWADTSRPLYFPTLATAVLGLCSEVSSIL